MGCVILPIDFHMFQDGYCTTNQVVAFLIRWCLGEGKRSHGMSQQRIRIETMEILNKGTLKSSIYRWIFHYKPSIYPFGGTPIYGPPHL